MNPFSRVASIHLSVKNLANMRFFRRGGPSPGIALLQEPITDCSTVIAFAENDPRAPYNFDKVI